MNALTELLGTAAVQALGWALLHALWQGTLVSLVLVFVLWLLRDAEPPLRYLAACAALMLMLLLPILTYALLVPHVKALPEYTFDLVKPSPRPSHDAQPATAQIEPPPAASSRIRLEPFLPYLVAAWFIGVFLFSVRLLGGLWLLSKLEKHFNEAVSEALTVTCRDLAQRLGVSRAVGLRESLAVRVPLVIGWLRPVILLPTSTLTGLSAGQLELILAHELAHIRRNDYLVNLLQHVVETLLFYHPAVWWVSAKIREEREHCCDDLALRVCNGDKTSYAKALAKLDNLRLEHLAPAATGGSLLKRIRRLAGKTLPERPDPIQGTVGLVLILVPLLSFSLVRANGAQPVILGTYVTAPFTVEELMQQGFSPAVACENAGPWLMVFSESGFFSGNILSEEGCRYQNPFVTGSWRVSGKQLTFRDSQDLGCGLEEYSYSYQLRDGALTFHPIKDSCLERIYLFTTQMWKRPS